MTVIATNISALRAANASTSANNMLSTSMQRLSTGSRINSAKDDAAGLAISSSMTSQIRGMTQGIRNSNDGIAMAQTADGALDEVTNMIQRVRELAVQSASGTYSDSDRTDMQTEVTALTGQITNILKNTDFNGVKLFDGSAGTAGAVTIQTGSNTADTVTLNLKTLDLTTAVATDITTQTKASGVLDTLNTALQTVTTARAGLGAAESQLTSVVANMTSDVTNLTAAKSQISDTDFSAETASLAKAQILSQASTAMLAQANQSQQGVLKLLQ
ncbi:flagellin [Sphingomonas bacterium]|uniref:flagellin N-terminal helical domain-containing protein n=1 Tax=Sphingomonas bacterium TaxID=1895847 RepID=UPI0015765F27|nr:flagellin [Sphingomonas bacterium]